MIILALPSYNLISTCTLDVSMERADGFQGPIIISDPDNDDEKQLEDMYDEEATVFLQDWYHLDGRTRRTGLDTSVRFC